MLRLILLFFFSVAFYFAGFSQQHISARNSPEVNFNSLAEEIYVHTDKSFYVSGEVLWFKIYVLNAASRKLQPVSHTAYVELIGKGNQAVLQAKVRIDSGTGSGSFYLPASLESGNFVMRAYTAWMKNNPESVFEKALTVINTRNNFDTSLLRIEPVVATGQPLNNGNSIVQVSAGQPEYKTRSQAEVKISSSAGSGVYNLSASVYQLSALNDPRNDISFPGYLQSNKHIANKGNRKFDSSIFSGNQIEFLPELNGILVTVAAKKRGTNMPAPHVPVYLSVRGKLANVQAGKTNAEGLAYFNFRDLYGQTQLVLQTDTGYQAAVDLSLEKSVLNKKVSIHFSDKERYAGDTVESALESLHNQTVVTDAYAGKKLDSFAVTNIDSTSFYGKPYKTYLLDNYKRFVTMEEVLREYVQEVNVRIRNKNYYFQTFNRQFFDLGRYMTLDYMMTNGSPLVLLDGVPIFDNNKIIQYNPLLVRKLEVVADRFHIGPQWWNGVMSFTTYKGELEDIRLDSKDVVADFSGWQRPRYFYQPDYSLLENKNSRLPDFRNVLYWNGDIKMAESTSLKFFTGDLTGKFIVVVQGISDRGIPVYETATFEVVR